MRAGSHSGHLPHPQGSLASAGVGKGSVPILGTDSDPILGTDSVPILGTDSVLIFDSFSICFWPQGFAAFHFESHFRLLVGLHFACWSHAVNQMVSA